MPDSNGETRRTRNERFGEPSPEVRVPERGAHIWDWFWQLSARRKSGPEALTFADVGEWTRLLLVDRANSMADSAGVVERAWKGALAAFAGAMESIKTIGANDLDSQLQRARDDLEFFQSLSRSPIPGDASRGSTGADAARQRIAQLQQWKAEMADGAAILGQVRQYDRDVIAAERELAKEREVADQAVKARMAGLDRETAKRQAINKIIADYNKLEDNDARHFDGSMQRLIAKAEADVNRQFNRREGVGKKNGDDSAAQNVLATAQRQIEANKQLVDTGIKVTDSERQAMAIEQLLAKSKNTMASRGGSRGRSGAWGYRVFVGGSIPLDIPPPSHSLQRNGVDNRGKRKSRNPLFDEGFRLFVDPFGPGIGGGGRRGLKRPVTH